MKITYLDSSNIWAFLSDRYLLVLNDGKGWSEDARFDLFLSSISKIISLKLPESECMMRVNMKAISYEVLVGAVIIGLSQISVWGNYTIVMDGKNYDNRAYINGVVLEGTVQNALGWKEDLSDSKAMVVEINSSEISVAFEGRTVVELHV